MTRREPDAIREAVGAGVRAFCGTLSNPDTRDVACARPCQLCREGAPAAIVAFLRAAADVHAGCYSGMDPRGTLKHLAAAVDRAAKEAGDG
jgi:hypothetical protein